MGSDFWSEWCDCELDGFKLPAVERKQAVVELAEHGLSNRAIADALNDGYGTVHRDRDESPDPIGSPDRAVVGQDGKTYTKSKPSTNPTPPDYMPLDITRNVIVCPFDTLTLEPTNRERHNAMTQLYEPVHNRLTDITGKSKRALTNGISAGTIPGVKVAGTWLVSTSYVDELIDRATSGRQA